MNPAKILLLDLNRTDDLTILLTEAFKPLHNCNEIQFRCEKPRLNDILLGETELRDVLSSFQPDSILLASAPGSVRQAQPLFHCLRTYAENVPVLVLTDVNEAGEAAEWLDLGARDVIPAPFEAHEVLRRVWQLLEDCSPQEILKRLLKEKLGRRFIVGESPAFLNEINKIPMLANCSASVLITGETGTGKELCARAVHYLSQRSSKPFIPVNCGAIPSDLVENELFGHERGAYTDAKNPKIGLIQEADGGTLFLDEIDCLPILSQVKLLRFLQEKEYRPLGATKVLRADVRVIAATNSDPEDAVQAGKLRQDFYYRLNVIPIQLPPLRERREDILPLARHFLSKFAPEFNKQVEGFSSEVIQSLVSYDWPGNVRELEHIVMRAVALSSQKLITNSDLKLTRREAVPCLESFRTAKDRMVEEFEKNYIKKLLLIHDGNISRAAKTAQKNRRAFWQLIRKHHIDVKALKSATSK